ncbi:MAG: hypothetical protein SGPRY_010665, partial [Prymnesium sp.]
MAPAHHLSTAAVSCESVTLRWPPAVRWVPPVLEFGVWIQRTTGQPPHDAPRRYPTDGLGETTLEVEGLQAGTTYAFEVRARSSDGAWRAYTHPREATTMAPSDFPLPILAPEVVSFVDCYTIRLRLPVLRSCYARTHVALQYSKSSSLAEEPQWLILREKVMGGELEVGRLEPYATHRFRLMGFDEASGLEATPGSATPPLLTDMMHSSLLAPPL